MVGGSLLLSSGGLLLASAEVLNVLELAEKTIIHILNVNSRERTKNKIKEVEHIIGALGQWQGTDPATGFQLVKTLRGRLLRIAARQSKLGRWRSRGS
jgi:hypothetical protein